MYKEIGRKITSLTLLSILLASGITFAIPGAMPAAEASHNANLFVSSENSQFNNYFAGPQVIEVVINDNDIKTLDDVHGEPDVTVNGKKLRMAQATDGNWYGYFASRVQATAADEAVGQESEGLDFGTFCASTTASSVFGVSFAETTGFAVARVTAVGGTNGTAGSVASPFVDCTTAGPNNGLLQNHVVRENKTLNTNPAVPTGQIALAAVTWPVIQLYDFSVGGNVVVNYNKGGGTQTTTLTFDTIPSNLINVASDRTTYPLGSAVHLTMTDPQLNIDPSDEDSWTWVTLVGNSSLFYQAFDENGGNDAAFDTAFASGAVDFQAMQTLTGNLTTFMFEKNGKLEINMAAQTATVGAFGDNDDQIFNATITTVFTTNMTTFTESSPKSGILGNYDESDNANIDILSTPTSLRGQSATVRYNDVSHSIVVGFGFATIDINAPDGAWGSGEEIPVTLVDSDSNTNSRADEDLDLNANTTALIPSLRIGTPFTLASGDRAIITSGAVSAPFGAISPLTIAAGANASALNAGTTVSEVQTFSGRAMLTPNATVAATSVIISHGTRTGADLFKSINNPTAGVFNGLNMFNYDVRSLSPSITSGKWFLLQSISPVLNANGEVGSTANPNGVMVVSIANVTTPNGLVSLNATDLNNNIFTIGTANFTGLMFNFTATGINTGTHPIVADFFSFGYLNDGLKQSDRINNAIYRFELEETGDNTSTFIGSAEYTMLNQLNIVQAATYTGLRTIDDEVTFIVHDDQDDEDAPRINYNDLGADGSVTPTADQQDAPTHSGVVSFDKDTYKLGDTVTVTLEDADLNVDSDLIDIYVTVAPGATNALADPAADTVGRAGLPSLTDGTALGRLLDITFDDLRWVNGSNTAGGTGFGTQCTTSSSIIASDGLSQNSFSMIETAADSGVLKGDFLLPPDYCDTNTGTHKSVTGVDIEVNYADFRDASGQSIEVGDGAGIRANTGSVSLDRTIYPVPFGPPGDTGSSGSGGFSIFPIHLTGIGGTPTEVDTAAEALPEGILTVIVRVTDPDFDISFTGQDTIGQNNTVGTNVGPVKITVSRGSSEVTLGYAGGSKTNTTAPLDVGDNSPTATRQFGPMTEIAPDAGIFEVEVPVLFSDGPADSKCPPTGTWTSLITGLATAVETDRFDTAHPTTTNGFCILQGDIITIEYTDPSDASGDQNTVTDSATFDLRNGVLQSDKSVYIIGADMIMTLIEPDLDLDSDTAESYDLDLIEWDSDAATVTMGDRCTIGTTACAASFDPEPSDFRETGDNTGIFQVVIEIPGTLGSERLDRGEEIQLEYTDWGPAGADFVGDEDEDINLTVYTSNFGATVELDQKVYTWTDKVFMTIVAPDHNFDSNLIDEIGDTSVDKVTVSTRGNKLSTYKLVETGTDTGIFTGEVILTGFSHDADGNVNTGTATTGVDTNPRTTPASAGGPTNGFLQSDDDDGLTVSFEFTEDETVVGSALIRWNIGEVQFLEASYPATGQGVLRIVDRDLNLNPEAVDNFDVDVWSDSDAGGIDLTVTETNEATGIFEGTVYFTVTDESSGHRLRVAEGDTVTGEYEDNTLPSPYTTADELEVTATTFIGTVVPPLERAPASNPRVVDAFGNELDEVNVDQQVQITADLANGQDRDQPFAYLVQISKDGVTHSLSWITGSLAPGQSLNPAQSWTPTESGTYDVQIFVWESVDNPDALSPPVETTVTVV